ncbi:hypothetical protein TIFTF001_013546 [Ficus carica]|uniref:Uncharacterized protein n=2 Tax=Ficus carica TaxID=3494 RepID=A0AA88AI19_FICCA|nr:hypothetical protein TIFTF001_013546 [Ficus carica]
MVSTSPRDGRTRN